MSKTFKLQKELSKTDSKHEQVFADSWRDKKEDWVDYVKKDVLCTTFSIARYRKALEEITGFGRKVCLSLPGLGWKYSNSLRTDENEPTYTYNDIFIRWFF